MCTVVSSSVLVGWLSSCSKTKGSVGNGISHLSPATRAISVLATAMAKDVWTRTSSSNTSWQRSSSSSRRQQQYLDRSVDMEVLLAAIGQTQNEDELYAVMSPYNGRQLSMRFMVSLLSREPDWQRALALLDWINDKALYRPSLFAYNVLLRNVLLRNVLRAKQWHLAHGLFDEMRQKGLSPDRWSKTTSPATSFSTVT